MPAVNHLKDLESQNLFHAVAYGKHLVTGTLAKSRVTGTAPNHIITVQQMLGRGEWDGCEGLWWKGVEIKPSEYRFYRGVQAALPVHKTYTADSSTDYLTVTAHGYSDGDQILLAPGSLPGGLFTDLIYYVKNKTTNTFQLSAINGGTAVDLTSNGSGTLKLWKNDTAQGIDPVFASDTPHSNVAWIVAQLGTGLGEFDTAANPPYGLTGIFRTSRINDYDTDGDVTGYAYSANPARIVADLILAKGGLPSSRIDWAAWCAWRDYLDEEIAYDYTVLPKFDGFGLTAKLYNGTAFDTLVAKRIDPVIEFGPSAGSPGVGVNTDNFSVVYEGWLKAKYTETYTFYLTHTHGARLYIDEAGDPPIDQWAASGTHSTTFDMVAGQFYYFKIEWKHTTGNAEIRIEWESPSQKREVINHRYLYPAVENRPRYEAHPFWAGPTRLDDAVRVVLNLCNSTVQEVGGKLKFLCLEQLTTQSYHFNAARIVDGSVVLKARDTMALRNTWQVNVRDIDSQYLERPLDPVLIERPTLIDSAGRKIDGEAIELFNCSMHQAYRTLDNIVKRLVDSKFQLELTGTADSFAVLAGDRVKADVEFMNWTEKDMLVLESNDLSSEETADERTFVMQEWPAFTTYAAAGSEGEGVGSGDIEFVQDATGSDTTTVLSITFGANVAADGMVVLLVICEDTATIESVLFTDGSAAALSEVASETHSFGGTKVSMWAGIGTGNETGVEIEFAAETRTSAIIAEFANVASATAEDSQVGQGSGTTATSPDITPSSLSNLVIYGIGLNNPDALTSPPSNSFVEMTSELGSTYAIHGHYLIRSNDDSLTNTDVGWDDSRDWAYVGAAFGGS